MRAVRVCHRHGVPLVPRGGGTSVAGNAVTEGVVLDLSRHMDQILDIDPGNGLARVEPGVVLDDLREAAAPHGLTFGPDPSTHSRCTIGGMIGNDACGSHSVAWGRTSDNVVELDVVLADGTRMTVGRHTPREIEEAVAAGGERGRVLARLRALVERHLAAIRFEVTLGEGQALTISVPGRPDEPGQALEISRAGGKLRVTGADPVPELARAGQ